MLEGSSDPIVVSTAQTAYRLPANTAAHRASARSDPYQD